MHYKPEALILLVLIGGLLGMVGQGIRVVVGLKKLYDESFQSGQDFGRNFSTTTLLFSLLIGFIAGVLGALSLADFEQGLSKDQVLTLIGIGYAGADFIEGFIKKNAAKLATVPSPSTSGGDDVEPAMG